MDKILTVYNKITHRGSNLKEETIEDFKKEIGYLEHSFKTTRLKSSDNRKQVDLSTMDNPKFLHIVGRYLADDNALNPPVRKGDPAPFKVTLDVITNTEQDCSNGLFEIHGAYSSLWISTDYENDIEISLIMAG
jgi:hypothetical protein